VPAKVQCVFGGRGEQMIHLRTTLALTFGSFLAGILLTLAVSLSLAERASGHWRYDGSLEARNALEAESVRHYRNSEYDEAAALMDAAAILRSLEIGQGSYKPWSFWFPVGEMYFAILGQDSRPPKSTNALLVSRRAALAFYNKAGNLKGAAKAFNSVQALSTKIGIETCDSLGLTILEAYP
jgi:hypothetical protein